MLTKARVRQWLEERFLLRVHMTLILGGTFLAGLMMTRLLMVGGVNNLAVRYLVAVGAAYLAFLVLVRVWLAYVGSSRSVDISGDAVDFVAETTGGPDEMPLPRGGGNFGGGGASGSWKNDLAGVAPSRSGGGGRGGGGSSFDFGDLDDLIVVVLVVVIVAFAAGFAIYFIYTAPVILSEAAFEAALAGALARRARKATGPGWIGAITRATIWPFLGVLVLSGLLGYFAQRACPSATRLSHALTECPQPRL